MVIKSRKEAAEMLKLSVSTLEKMAREKTGPSFFRISARRVVYDLADLEAWQAKQKEAMEDAVA